MIGVKGRYPGNSMSEKLLARAILLETQPEQKSILQFDLLIIFMFQQSNYHSTSIVFIIQINARFEYSILEKPHLQSPQHYSKNLLTFEDTCQQYPFTRFITNTININYNDYFIINNNFLIVNSPPFCSFISTIYISDN